MLFFNPLVFSKLRIGKIPLLKINLPIKECLKYLGNLGNFFPINLSIIVHMHLTAYGIVAILSIKDWIISSTCSCTNKKFFKYILAKTLLSFTKNSSLKIKKKLELEKA